MIGNSLAKLYWNDASATSKAALHPSLLRARPTKNRTTFHARPPLSPSDAKRPRRRQFSDNSEKYITCLPRDMSTVVALFISILPAAILRIFRSISRRLSPDARFACCGCFFLRLCSLSACVSLALFTHFCIIKSSLIMPLAQPIFALWFEKKKAALMRKKILMTLLTNFLFPSKYK